MIMKVSDRAARDLKLKGGMLVLHNAIVSTANDDDVYDMLVKSRIWGWFMGGCSIFAEGIAKVLGLPIVVIGNRGPAPPVGYWKSQRYVDYPDKKGNVFKPTHTAAFWEKEGLFLDGFGLSDEAIISARVRIGKPEILVWDDTPLPFRHNQKIVNAVSSCLKRNLQ